MSMILLELGIVDKRIGVSSVYTILDCVLEKGGEGSNIYHW